MPTLKKNPLVSIIMPAYNAAQYIAASIDSVINQTYENWELIVVNDGSSDNTQEIIDAYALKDPRIKGLNQLNQGMGASRNNGYAISKGFWISYLDSDDLWHPTKLEKELEVTDENAKYDVVFSEGWSFNNDDLNELSRYRTKAGIYDNVQMYREQLTRNIITVCSVMVKRSIIEVVGGWDESKANQGCADYDYWFRMARAGANFICVPETLFYYRIHDTNYSKNVATMLMAEGTVLLNNYDRDMIRKSSGSLAFQIKLHHRIQRLLQIKEIEKARVLLERWNSISPTVLGKLSANALKSLDGKGFLLGKLLLKLERGKLGLFSKIS
jgi:teichuronic acid biosynthesis glycosyltransferase TuaG